MCFRMAPQQLAPPLTTVNMVSPGHLRRHAAVSAQLKEQPPAQVTSQLDPGLQEMLPLAPSVTPQEAFSPQSTLQESPHVPLHVASAPQASVQLPPQTCVVKLHDVAAAHAQLLPVQSGVGDVPPQAVTNADSRIARP